jgi:hypothetical protein
MVTVYVSVKVNVTGLRVKLDAELVIPASRMPFGPSSRLPTLRWSVGT